jgi:hypothetical protein
MIKNKLTFCDLAAMLFPPSHILFSHETKIGLFFFNFYNKFLDENCRAHKTSKTDSSPNKVKWWFPNRVSDWFHMILLVFKHFSSNPYNNGIISPIHACCTCKNYCIQIKMKVFFFYLIMLRIRVMKVVELRRRSRHDFGLVYFNKSFKYIIQNLHDNFQM